MFSIRMATPNTWLPMNQCLKWTRSPAIGRWMPPIHPMEAWIRSLESTPKCSCLHACLPRHTTEKLNLINMLLPSCYLNIANISRFQFFPIILNVICGIQADDIYTYNLIRVPSKSKKKVLIWWSTQHMEFTRSKVDGSRMVTFSG